MMHYGRLRHPQVFESHWSQRRHSYRADQPADL